MSKSPYKLSYKIEQKLFQGIVIPTALEQGYDMSDQHKVVRMMQALVDKYHNMSKTHKKALINKAEKNIEKRLSELNKGSNE